jgi:hypothetical protein
VLWIIGGMAFKPSHDVTMAIGSLLIALNFIYNVRGAFRCTLTSVHPWTVVLHHHRRDVVDSVTSEIDCSVAHRLPDYEHYLRDYRSPHAIAHCLELGT